MINKSRNALLALAVGSVLAACGGDEGFKDRRGETHDLDFTNVVLDDAASAEEALSRAVKIVGAIISTAYHFTVTSEDMSGLASGNGGAFSSLLTNVAQTAESTAVPVDTVGGLSVTTDAIVCTDSGTYKASVLAEGENSGMLTFAGQQVKVNFEAAFSSCKEDLVVMDGILGFGFTSIPQEGMDFGFSAGVRMKDFSMHFDHEDIEDDEATVLLDGDLQISLLTKGALFQTSMSGEFYNYSEGSAGEKGLSNSSEIRAFTTDSSVDTNTGAYSIAINGASIDLQYPNENLNFYTDEAIEGINGVMGGPTAGIIVAEHDAENGKIGITRLTVISKDEIRVEQDYDGDEVFETNYSITWNQLLNAEKKSG